jgi:Protein of unknown function (DUF4232)
MLACDGYPYEEAVMDAVRGRRGTRLAVALAIAVGGICAASAAVAHASAASAASTQRCRLNQLSLARPKSNGALGSVRLRFVFTNRSTATCKLFGFPGLQMLNKHHANLHTVVIRGTSNVVPPEPELDVVMTPGQHGSFYAGYSDVPTGTQTCPAASFLEVTPPNAFKHFTQLSHIAPCGGKITVSPVVHGRLPV